MILELIYYHNHQFIWTHGFPELLVELKLCRTRGSPKLLVDLKLSRTRGSPTTSSRTDYIDVGNMYTAVNIYILAVDNYIVLVVL